MPRRIVQYEYHRPGKKTTVYQQELLLERPDVSVLLMDPHEGGDVIEEGTVILPRGGSSLWFVFPDAWFDVGRFYRRDRAFTGWYTNLCMPVTKQGETWSSTDLFLDLWQPVDGTPAWLDEDELAAGVKSKLLDDSVVQRVTAERERIEQLMAEGAWPPEICRSFSPLPA